MNIENYVFKIIRKKFSSYGFNYSFFPNEHSFYNDSFSIVFDFSKSKLIDISCIKFDNNLQELSFNFEWVEFNDKLINDKLKKIREMDDSQKKVDYVVDFVIENEKFLNDYTLNDINDLHKYR